jgi:hypothetical protein
LHLKSQINPIIVPIDPKTHKLEMQLLFIDINAVKMLLHLRFLNEKVPAAVYCGGRFLPLGPDCSSSSRT